MHKFTFLLQFKYNSMSNFLRYGDLIVLTHSEQEGRTGLEQRARGEGEDKGGVLTTLGFIDTGLYFQYLPPQGGREKTDMANFKDGVFKITPKLNFDSHKEFKKCMEYYQNVEEGIRICYNEDETEKLTAVRDDLMTKIERLQERLKKEQLINGSIIRDSLGTFVKYGAEVQLMHFDSNTFVASSRDSSHTEKIGYTCFLGSLFTAGMIFRLLPRFKSRQEGDCIQIRDHLLIYNVKRQAYLSIAKDIDHTLYDDRLCGRIKNPFLIDPQIIDPRTDRHRVYLSQESQQTFQLMLYRRFVEDPKDDVLLWGGDMIRFMHSEIEADLTADISYRGEGETDLYFRQYQGEVAEELISAGSFWYIEHQTLEMAGERFHITSMEGNRSFCPTVRLRHVVTNRVVVPFQNRDHDPEQFSVGLCRDLAQSNLSISLELEPVVTVLSSLTHGQTVFVRDCMTQCYLSYSRQNSLTMDTDKLMNLLKVTDPEYEFAPLNEGDLCEIRMPADFRRAFSSEDAYRLSRISEEQRLEVLFLKSAIPFFKYVSQVFEKGTKSKEDWLKEASNLVSKSLQLVICFLLDKDIASGVEYFSIEEKPITRRQKFLRGSGLLCALIDFVYLPFRYGMVQIKELEENSPLRTALSLSYHAMRYSIKEYRPNELYLSQWIGLITGQSIKAQRGCDISAGTTLVELIDNNRRILETRIHKKTIKWFIDFLKETKEEHFVNILRVICICDGKPMQHNQRETAELLLKDKDVKEQLIFKIDPDLLDGILFYLDLPGYRRIPFKDFERVSSVQDGHRIYKYVVSLTRLLADLCRDRNYSAIDELQSDFTFDILYAVISDSEYPSDLRDAFTCLMVSLWVDVSPYQRVDLPIRIKIWDETKQNQLFKNSNTDASRFIVLKHFVTEYLKDMKRVSTNDLRMFLGPGNERAETRWSLDLSVLTLTNKMLWLGLFSDLTQINNIMTYLKNYLRSERSSKKKQNMTVGKTFARAISVFTSAFTSRTSLKKKVETTRIDTEELESPNLVIECKKKACEIVEFGILVANELRIGSYLLSFKEAIENLDPQVLLFLDQIISSTDQFNRQNQAFIKESRLPSISNFFEKTSEVYKNKLTETMSDLFAKVASQKTILDLDKDGDMLFSLVELVHYKNPALKEYAIYLLSMLHTQRRQLGSMIFDLQIIDDSNSQAHFIRAREYCLTINTIGDTIEKWYHDPTSLEMGSLGAILNKIYRSLLSIQRRGSIDNKDSLKTMLPVIKEPPLHSASVTTPRKISMNLVQPPPESFQGRRAQISPTFLDLKNQLNFSDIHQYHIDSEHESIDVFEQDLFRNSGIYEALIKMLKFDVEVLDRRRPVEGIHILRKIYRILAKSTKNCLTNKHYLSRFIERFIMPHFQETQDLNAYFLMHQLVVDNKLVLLDEGRVKHITDIICQMNEKLLPNDFRRAFNLFILRSMIHYKRLVLETSQNIVLGRLISKDFVGLQISLDPKEDKAFLARASNNNLSKCLSKANNKDVVIVPAEICYAIAYLELLASCAEENNPFAENVCQSLVSFETIQTLLAEESVSLILKKALVRFLFHVYLAHNREVAFHVIEVFLDTCHALSSQFAFYMRKGYLQQFEKVDMDYLMILTDDAFMPWTVVVEQYMHLLIDCLLNITKRDLHLVKESEPYRILEEFLETLHEYITEAKYKLNSRSLDPKLDELHRRLASHSKKGKKGDDFKPRLISVSNEYQRTALANTRVKTSIIGRVNLFKKIETLIDFYFHSEEYKKSCSEEFFELIRNLVYMEKATAQLSDPVKLTNIFANIARFVHASLADRSSVTHPETLTTSVEIFRRYIEAQSVTSLAKMPALFEEDFWKKYQPMIKSRQDRLCTLKIPALVCRILTASDDLVLLREAFILGIALLWGGNSNAQDGFLAYFEEEEESNSLLRIRQLMLSSFAVVAKNMAEKNMQTTSSYLSKVQKTRGETNLEEDREQVLQTIRNEVENLDINYALCKCIFKFLQLLCEGHNIRVQNCLRQQSSVSSLYECNFIASTANLWGSYIKVVNPDCEDLGVLILNFLIESIQGPCEGNQKELYQNKMIEYTKDFMSDFLAERDYAVRGFDATNSVCLDALILKSIKVLHSMQEANSSRETYLRMGVNIDLGYLMKKLTNEFTSIMGEVKVDLDTTVDTTQLFHLDAKIEGKVFDARFSEAFEIFFFLSTINDYTGCYNRAISELRGLEAHVYAFFASHSATIEIVFNDSIQKEFFVVHPACKFLDESEKQVFLNKANRDSAILKLKDFVGQVPRLFDRMEHMATLQSCLPIASEKLFHQTRNLCFLVVLAINVYMFFNFEKEVRNNEFYTYTDPTGEVILTVLGLLHLLMCFVVTTIWCILNANLTIVEGWRHKFCTVRKYMLLLEENEQNKIVRQEVLLILEKIAIDLTRQDILLVMTYYYKETGRTFTLPWLEYYGQKIVFLMSNKLLGVQVFFIALSFVAFFGRVRILYAVHLFDLINMFDTMKNIVRAITHNSKQLLLTAFLAIILLYFYSLIAFLYVDDTFWLSSVEPSGESLCNTLIQCFTTVAALGPRSAGSVGDVLLRPSYGQDTGFRLRFYIRWVYDVSIFFIVNIICMKLIFGIILDTFAQFRDQRNALENDRNNVCYICSLERYIFDKHADGFEMHIRRDHKLWNYLYFMYFLKKKDSTEYTGIESYVAAQVFRDDTDWLPLGKAYCLKVGEAYIET